MRIGPGVELAGKKSLRNSKFRRWTSCGRGRSKTSIWRRRCSLWIGSRSRGTSCFGTMRPSCLNWGRPSERVIGTLQPRTFTTIPTASKINNNEGPPPLPTTNSQTALAPVKTILPSIAWIRGSRVAEAKTKLHRRTCRTSPNSNSQTLLPRPTC